MNLVENVKCPSAKQILYPCSIYFYKSLTDSLKEIMKQSDFIEMCEQWCQLVTPSDVYNDVYDGEVWKDFQT